MRGMSHGTKGLALAPDLLRLLVLWCYKGCSNQCCRHMGALCDRHPHPCMPGGGSRGKYRWVGASGTGGAQVLRRQLLLHSLCKSKGTEHQ